MSMQESEQTLHEPAADFGSLLLRVAWLAILLGIAMEVVLLVLGGGLGEMLGLAPVVADFVRNITWSVFVCVGLVFGGARIALASSVTPQPPAADLLVEGVNEILFPVGCALVLFSAGALGKRAANRN